MRCDRARGHDCEGAAMDKERRHDCESAIVMGLSVDMSVRGWASDGQWAWA